MEQRTIRIGGSSKDCQKFCSNRVSTTIYSVRNFLPRFLFKHISFKGLFLLFVALLQLIPDGPRRTRWGALNFYLLILVADAAIEIHSDLRRYMDDIKTNEQVVEVYHCDGWIKKKSEDLQVRDIVRVYDGSFLPADSILLSSSDPQGLCYIKTSDLDGEKELKVRQGLDVTRSFTSPEALSSLRCSIRYDEPNSYLKEFSGTFKLKGKKETLAISPDQLLLRGAQLELTEWAIAIVVYTGHETKLLKNSALRALPKRSRIDMSVDAEIGVMFKVLLSLSLCFLFYHNERRDYVDSKHLLLDIKVNFFLYWIHFMLVFYPIVPTKVLILMMATRFIMTKLSIKKDSEMCDRESNTAANVRSPHLNEDLGRVKYIFMDKTGTLTQNEMQLEECSIGGTIYPAGRHTPVAIDEPNMRDDLRPELDHPNAPFIREFLTVLAVCNNTTPDWRGKEVHELPSYLPTISDDRILVEGAARLGWVLWSRTPELITILADGREERYEVLHVFDFTSERKRMSVIVRTPSGKIKLYVKGADEVIYERLGAPSAVDPQFNQEHIRQATTSHLETFKKKGMRILCCAVAEIPVDVYEEWRRTYDKADLSPHNRERKVADAMDLIEKNLVLLGANAIDDELQHEVPQTIDALRLADIQMWLLTGDKKESAIKVGYDSHLIDKSMKLVELDKQSLQETRVAIQNELRDVDNLSTSNDSSPPIVLVIGDATLKYALNCDLKKLFVRLCLKSCAVIAYGLSPSQKGQIVKAVNEETGAVTVAIGDGANDIAMLQKASIGIGISGRAASHASDYSIGQFRFLRRLLLVHGAHSYYRMARLILVSHFMNITFHIILLLFTWQSPSHSHIFLDPWFSAYNFIFTCPLPLLYGLFDRPRTTQVAYEHPELYKPSQSGQYLCAKEFALWTGRGVIQSVLVFYLQMALFGQRMVGSDATEANYFVRSNAVLTYALVTASLTAVLKTKLRPILSLVAIVGSVLISCLSFVIYCHFWGNISVETIGASMTELISTLFLSPLFWAGFIFIPSTVLLLGFFLKLLLNTQPILKLSEQNRRVSQTLDSSECFSVVVIDERNRRDENAALLV